MLGAIHYQRRFRQLVIWLICGVSRGEDQILESLPHARFRLVARTPIYNKNSLPSCLQRELFGYIA